MKELIPLIDADTNAFNDYMTAMKMPKKTETEIKNEERENAEGLKKAVTVPLSVMRISDSCWQWMTEMAKYGKHCFKKRSRSRSKVT